MYVLAPDAATPVQWPPVDAARALTPGNVPVSVGIFWCACCGLARQNKGSVRAPIQECNRCSVVYCNTQCANKHFPSHVCIPDQVEASARARDRGEQITQNMAAQLEQEILTAEASKPRIVADQAELACRQLALRTVDMVKGEERKRMAALIMQALNHHP